MSYYDTLDNSHLEAEISALESQINEFKAADLKLNMARGKPSPEQLALSMPLLDAVNSDTDFVVNGVDYRNYGILEGIPEARQLMGDYLGLSMENIIIGGESSLNLMYDSIARGYMFGVNGGVPYSKQETIKWLCPVPGYDRHFKVTDAFGFVNIAVPMNEDGPDMDVVEKFVKDDPTIKGIWCVPKFGNPTGAVYSDEVVRRLAALTPAACDFRIYWDNAYGEHYLYDEHPQVLEILSELEHAGNPDGAYVFASTSKVTFPGSGISCIGTSLSNIADITAHMSAQTIGHDKINQLRHMKFFDNIEGLRAHMAKHAQILAPKFQLTQEKLLSELGDLDIASWSKPLGGYFVSFDTLPGCATEVVALCLECGVTLTGAGATYPYGIDIKDTNIRIAPSYPNLKELGAALDIFITAVKLVSAKVALNAR